MIFLINMEYKDFNEFNPTNENLKNNENLNNNIKNTEISTYFEKYYYK